jgi:tetratricopeptide (TPR) repeat protein
MLQPKPARLPEALATGLLAKKPLAHLLVYALDRKLTGTFELVDQTQERVHIAVTNGLIARVSTSEPIVYLGHVLYESGVIDGGQMSSTLAEVASTKRLHGQILLAKGMLFPDQLADGLREQRARKLQHAFELSGRTTFAFYPGVDLVGERPSDVEPADPLPTIWRGIATHPSWDHVRATMATVDGRRLRVVGAVPRLGLKAKQQAAAEHLRRSPSTVTQLATVAGMDARAAELLAYFLVITKLAEIVERVGVPTAPAARPSSLGVALSSGEYVRKMSFSMRAVTGDRSPLRIPSPMPGTLPSLGGLRAVPTPPPISLASHRDTASADQALSQAEMHFVLGERDQAVTLTRKALSDSPGMPEAMAFLAYLEALGLADGQDDLLRDFLRMIDAAIRLDDTCRRGRFYRAEMRKRLGDHEGAIQDLRVAVMNDPDDAAAQRALRAYEQKLRDGSIVIRSMSPAGGTPKPVGLIDRLRGK